MTTAAKDPAELEEPVERVEDDPVLEMEEYATPTRPSILFRTEEERKAGKEPTRYEIKVPEEMGVAEEQQFRSEVGEYGRLMASPEALKKAERAKLEQRLNQLFNKVLIAPPEIRAHFNDKQKQVVVQHFQIALFSGDAAGVERALQAMTPGVARAIESTMAT